LRILLYLEALNDQNVWDASQYRKVQGFVYDKLIANTEFRGIHNLKNYKFFCFSNIFPPKIAKSGELRHLLVSSPDIHLVKSIFACIKEINDQVINIGEQQYSIKSSELLETKIVAR
jgi:CRISPR-associated endoribonuclease Cas6